MPSTADGTTTTPVADTDDVKPQLELGLAQVAASGLAGISASLAASFLGVAGTIIGAAVGAVIATIGSAVYAHSLKRAGTRLRDLRPAGTAPSVLPATQQRPAGASPAGARTPAAWPWLRGLVLVLLGATVALGGITLAERVLGHPVSTSDRTGTSIGRVVNPSAGSPAKAEVTTPGPSPTASATDVTTATATATATTTATATATATAPPSATATADPGASPNAPAVAPTQAPTQAPTDGTQPSTGGTTDAGTTGGPTGGQGAPGSSAPQPPAATTAPSAQASLPAPANAPAAR